MLFGYMSSGAVTEPMNRLFNLYPLSSIDGKPPSKVPGPSYGIVLGFDELLQLDENKLLRSLGRLQNKPVLALIIEDVNYATANIDNANKKLIKIYQNSNISGLLIKFKDMDTKNIIFITKNFASIIKGPSQERFTGILLPAAKSCLIEGLVNNNIQFFIDGFGIMSGNKSHLMLLREYFPGIYVFYASGPSTLRSMVKSHFQRLQEGYDMGFVFTKEHACLGHEIFDRDMFPESARGLVFKDGRKIKGMGFFNMENLVHTLVFNGSYTDCIYDYDGYYIDTLDLDSPELFIVNEGEIFKGDLSFRLNHNKRHTRLLNINEGDDLIIIKYVPYSLKKSPKYSEHVEVADEKTITAEDVLARFYPLKIVSDTMLEHYTAYGTTYYYFTAPSFPDKIEIKTNDIYFYEKSRPLVWKEKDIFINGSRWSREGFPEIPFIGSGNLDLQPSNINFDDSYYYTLEGKTNINERECYIIRFKSEVDGLPSGSLYIDDVNYQLIRLEYSQKGLVTPIVSTYQAEDYAYITIEGTAYIVPERIRTHEVINIAGRNIFIDKIREYTEIFINYADYHEKKQEYFSSSGTMMQMTRHGPKILKSDGQGNRVLQEEMKRSFLFLVGGVLGDMGSNYPLLPLAGINYFDYDFMNKGHHLNLFTAIAVNTLTFSTPRPVFGGLFSSLSFDAVVPVMAFTDRLYHEGEHLKGHDINIYSMNVNMGLTKSLNTHINLYLLTQFRYSNYMKNDNTFDDYSVPDKDLLISQSSELQVSYFGLTGNISLRYFYRFDDSMFGTLQKEEDNVFYGRKKRNFMQYNIMLKKDLNIFGIKSMLALSYGKIDKFDRFNLLDLGGPGGMRGFSQGIIKTDEYCNIKLITGVDIADILKWKLYLDTSYIYDIIEEEYKLYYGTGFSFSFIMFNSFICNFDYGYGFNQPIDAKREGNHRFMLSFIRFLK